MDGTETGTMDGITNGMVGITGVHGLLQLEPSLNLLTGGMTHGEDGTTNGMDGTPHGDGIPHGDQDPPLGDMETSTGMDGTEESPLLEQELLLILKPLK